MDREDQRPGIVPACMDKHLSSAQYRADGTLLLTASSLSCRTWQGSVWIYKCPMKAPTEELCKVAVQTSSGVTDAKWVSENNFVVATDSGSLWMWKLWQDDSALVNTFTKEIHDNIVTSVSLTAGANSVVTGSMDCRIKVLDLSQETIVTTYNAHTQPVNCVACSPTEESLFISCGQDGRVLMWDRRKPDKPATRLGINPPSCSPTSVAWHPQKRSTIAIGDELGRVTMKDFTGNKPNQLKEVHSRRINNLAFSTHSDAMLASVSDDCSVAVLNSNLQEIFRDRQHQDFVQGGCWMQGGSNTLTTIGWDHLVLHHTVSPDGAPITSS